MNTVKKTGLAVLLFFIAALISNSLPAGGFGTLQGKVTDKQTGKPIAGALVKVKAGEGITATTNENGIYIFNNTVPTGRHNVVVNKRGYKKKTAWFVKIASGTNTLDMRLRPRPSD